MTDISWGFPIAGSTVSDALRSRFLADEIWLASFIDVPSGPDSPELLNELRDRIDCKQPAVSTADLCEALIGAPQVWVLDIRLARDRNIQLYIEDGEVFEVNVDRGQHERLI